MNAPFAYAETLPLKEKILYVLHLHENVSTQDIATNIMELDGVAAEEAVARLHIEVEQALEQLLEEGSVERLQVHGRRYALAPGRA